MTEPHHSESYQKWELKSSEISQVLDSIRAISKPEFRALASFLYLTGCRISEVLPYQGKSDWEHKEGIKKHQVTLDPSRPNAVNISAVRCLKRRIYRQKKETYTDDKLKERVRFVADTNRRTDKKTRYREIGFSIGPQEQPFWDTFWEYASQLPSDAVLFPYTRYQAYRAIAQRTYTNPDGSVTIKKGGQINPHAIRHQRFSHFVKVYKLHPQQLRKQAGWASSLTADKYVNTSTEDLITEEERIQKELK